MNRLPSPLAAVLAVAACTSAPSPAPTAVAETIDGVQVLCSPPSVPTTLSCDAAVAIGLPAAGFSASDVDSIEFHYGMTCAALKPASPCPPAPPNLGYLVFHLPDRSQVALEVWTLSNGQVVAAPRSFVVPVLPSAT